MKLITSQKLGNENGTKGLLLKIEAQGSVYSFSYAYEPQKWHLLKDSVDARFLSTKVAGGFVGCVYALYATSLGRACKNVSRFDWFEYRGDDEVYR
jgi:alpha-N-arabinofuranosidase